MFVVSKCLSENQQHHTMAAYTSVEGKNLPEDLLVLRKTNPDLTMTQRRFFS